MAERIGTLVLGKNPFWKTRVELGKKNNQEFVQIPHAKFLELLTYKAEAVGIRVIVTEESYTSKASFLDLDVLPTYDPSQGADQEEKPHFSGYRDGRWYRVKGRAPIHSDVNGSYNIGRKVFPTAFGPGIEATAVRRHLACRLNYRVVADSSPFLDTVVISLPKSLLLQQFLPIRNLFRYYVTTSTALNY